jgi:hypothetical protein
MSHSRTLWVYTKNFRPMSRFCRGDVLHNLARGFKQSLSMSCVSFHAASRQRHSECIELHGYLQNNQ